MSLYYRAKYYYSKDVYMYAHTPCLKKLCKLIFCQNFVKFTPIVKIFGTKIAE